MVEHAVYRECRFLPLPSPKYCRDELAASCSDLAELVLALHSNAPSAQDEMSLREAAERRSQFARLPARSVSAPPRKKWFRKERATYEVAGRSSTGNAVCDEFTRKLVAAITTWHDIHSSLLRLSIERSSSDESIAVLSNQSSESDEEEQRVDFPQASRFSISNPELTDNQLKQMFPDLSEHWSYKYTKKVTKTEDAINELSTTHRLNFLPKMRRENVIESSLQLFFRAFLSFDFGRAGGAAQDGSSCRRSPTVLLTIGLAAGMMAALRKDSDDVFLPSLSSPKKRDRKKKKTVEAVQSNPLCRIEGPSTSTSPKTPKRNKKRAWRGESAARKLSEALPAALRSPTQILRRAKKPLGPSLSWDPERRSSRSPSSTARSRVHSDGSSDGGVVLDEEPHGIIEEPRFELELSCVHCAMAADYRRRMLKTEIESAVMRLARRLGNGRSGWHEEPKAPRGTTPDIVVSSISSDEEDHSVDRHTSSERGSSLQTSETSSPGSSSACGSPRVVRNGNDITFETPASDAATPPSPLRLRPPALLSPYPDSASPPRSNSVDLSTLRRDIELLSVSSGDSDGASETDFEPPTPAESVRTFRSKSHDPAATASVLRRPSRIEHLSELFRKALAKSPVVRRSAVDQEVQLLNKHRTSRYWLDEQIQPSEHIWLPSATSSSASADSECYVGEKDCRRQGEKRRCAACHVVAHAACFPLLAKLGLNCKMTFRDYAMKKSVPKESLDGLTLHHWVHKWRHEGRCNGCGKSFQQKMFFQGKEKKETIAVTCSWCKESYHLKNCFSKEKLAQKCERGTLREMVVPPNWILRLPNRKRNKNKQANRSQKRSIRQFVVKPTDLWAAGPSQPLVVFVNPKSGGNKGSKALHTLCWLLNPRQVFDITSLKGPKFGLEVFRKVVTQLRLLVCGGDGTVGWVLSTLDSLNWPAYPPMAIMPLGTGNDLARCMGWGGVFSDEPLSQLLQAILHETTVTHLDRWRIDVEPNTTCSLECEDDEAVQSALPLTVMNNYFSIGADAHVALQFHHSRSANPQMLNSRLKNRIAYGGLGTIDLFKRSWKDLSEFITLECDGVDVTGRIKELKLHCILFHNITYYAGGTIPWGTDNSDAKTSCCDGKVEVLGFTTATLATLQMGGKGERIAQCSRVRVVTQKPIPMQVDGEPCLLAPSIIHLNFHSKVPMLRREKKTPCTPNLMRRNTRADKRDSQVQSTSLIMQLPVIVVGRTDYDTYKDCFERLKDTAYEIGIINVEAEAELDAARGLIQRLLVEHSSLPYEPDKNWRFLDYVSNSDEGTFRVSRQQETLQSVSDVCNPDECVLILDHAFPSITDRSAEELFHPPASACPPPPPSQNTTRSQHHHGGRRISETLRIVLSSDAQETHL
ncbi:unnamed protein product [Caenorhabditis auriculariae]|uniref:Diacylglycerol kinase n=1 Tax=Caenorhabditis auriculariae TaxID=2777116 RepID=A0A8S1HHU1_9PELO|nr:unnamed protein product [Caenorhabditis auriculariae]